MIHLDGQQDKRALDMASGNRDGFVRRNIFLALRHDTCHCARANQGCEDAEERNAVHQKS
jgi:hypothetical protein